MNTKKTTWRFWLSLVILLVLVPLTVLVFSRFDRKYYLAGLAIIVLTTAAFFLHFESRKPQARELVILAVLCALAVASRAAFAAVPHFKPMLAIVMLTGIAFGPEAGFLCGAISGFASNFLFGQGPWTPWQMFAYGISGLLAGLSTAYREKGQEPPHFSGKTAIGAMGRYVSTPNARFQPMNCAFGLIDQLEVAPGEKRIRNKQLRYEAISKRALAEVEKIVAEMAKE